MPLAWLTRVVTPQSRIRPGSQKRQVPAGGALPRRFVSPRGRVGHALSVGREQPRRVPAFGTRVWPDVTAEHVSLVLRFLGRVPRTTPLYDCRPILTPRLWRRIRPISMLREAWYAGSRDRSTHTEACACAVTKPRNSNGRSVVGCYPSTREPEEGPMRQMRTPYGRSWLAERTQVRGDTTKGRGKARLDGRQGYPLACHAARARLGTLRALR